MQAPLTSATPMWLQALYSPAAVLAAVAFLFRFVLVPALLKLMRQDLAPELARIEQHNQDIPRIDGRVGTVEDTLSGLSGIPVSLARIEEQLKTLLKDRKHA